MPRRGGPISRAFGRLVLRTLRWRISGVLPNVPKAVVVAAPHRSNWDFVIAIAAKFALGLEASWLGKHTLFRGPFGAFFRGAGGIPVDRRGSQDTVASILEQFTTREKLILGLAPEGTRKPGTPWKTGFWHIAHGAGVPIVPMVLDRSNRIIHILPVLQPTALDADLSLLASQYAELVPGVLIAR